MLLFHVFSLVHHHYHLTAISTTTTNFTTISTSISITSTTTTTNTLLLFFTGVFKFLRTDLIYWRGMGAIISLRGSHSHSDATWSIMYAGKCLGAITLVTKFRRATLCVHFLWSLVSAYYKPLYNETKIDQIVFPSYSRESWMIIFIWKHVFYFLNCIACKLI